MPEFFSTHPADARRAADLRKLQSEAQRVYAQAPEKYGIGEIIAGDWSSQASQAVFDEARPTEQSRLLDALHENAAVSQ